MAQKCEEARDSKHSEGSAAEDEEQRQVHNRKGVAKSKSWSAESKQWTTHEEGTLPQNWDEAVDSNHAPGRGGNHKRQHHVNNQKGVANSKSWSADSKQSTTHE